MNPCKECSNCFKQPSGIEQCWRDVPEIYLCSNEREKDGGGRCGVKGKFFSKVIKPS